MMKKSRIWKLGLVVAVCLSVFYTPNSIKAESWNIIDKSFDSRGDWRENNKDLAGTFTYSEQKVQIQKSEILANETGRYAMLITPTTFQLPTTAYSVEVQAKANASLNPSFTGLENEISVRSKASTGTQGQIVRLFLTYGDATSGAVSVVGADGSDTITLDTSVYHDYQLIAQERASDNTRLYDVFIDGIKVFENIKTKAHSDGNTDLIRVGADRNNLVNMDVTSIHAANGFHMSNPNEEAIQSISLSTYSIKEKETSVISAKVQTRNMANNSVVTFQLLDSLNQVVDGVEATTVLLNNEATADVVIPTGIEVGEYTMQASVNGKSIRSSSVKVKDNLPAPNFPSFYPVGENIALEDFKYNPTQEWIFPSIVDTKEFPLKNGETPIDRYYLFYAPHDNPGGISLMSAPTLDGPWTEYDGNPLVGNEWGDYKVSHVSAADVVWNPTYQKFFMYFHGENNVGRYATSDNLVDWDYGGKIFGANDFSPTNSGLTECSYQRVRNYSITRDGETYDYVMTLMVNDNKNVRRIYMAYSKDGKDWITEKKPLISPENGKEFGVNYGTNIAGPFQVSFEGRNFIIVNASTGNLYAIEVGENYDKEIHWGMFYDSSDAWPDYGRSGGLALKQDDGGKWHLFYEGGVRLHGNIIHALEATPEEQAKPNRIVVKMDQPSMEVNSRITPKVEVTSLNLQSMDFEDVKKIEGVKIEYISSNPEVASYVDGVVTSHRAGTTSLSIRLSIGEYERYSVKSELFVSERLNLPVFEVGEVVVDPLDVTQMSKPNAANVGGPVVVNAKGMIGESALAKYYMYYSYDSKDTGIGMVYSDHLEGPWYAYDDGKPVVYRGLSSTSGAIVPKDKDVHCPTILWDSDKNQMNMYFTVNEDSVRLATSSDGLNFTYEKALFSTNTLGFKGNTTRTSSPMVYEHKIEGLNNKYVMVFAGKIGEMYRIDYAISNDGITWEYGGTLESPNPEIDNGNIHTPRLMFYQDNIFLLSSNSAQNVVISQVSKDFKMVNRIKDFMVPSVSAPDFGKVSDTFFYEEGDELHLFYTGGLENKNKKIIHSSTKKQAKVSLDIEDVIGGKITINPAYQTYYVGDKVTIEFIADKGYEFDTAFVNGVEVSLKNTRSTKHKYELTLTDPNLKITAKFKKVKNGDVETGNGTNTEGQTVGEQSNPSKTVINTGDRTNWDMFVLIVLTSGAMLLGILYKNKREEL